MSDIAMLVAEEYERRIRNSTRVAHAQTQIGEMDLFSSLSVSGGINCSAFGEEKKKDPLKLRSPMEPKTQIALAAIDGFFSA